MGRPYLGHIIRGRGIPPPPTDLGHFHENMVELWIVIEGELDFLVEGEPLVTGTVGDVVQAPNERWHRASFHGDGYGHAAGDYTAQQGRPASLLAA